MHELNELILECDKVLLALRNDEKVDLSRLYEICDRFNKRCVVVKVFECDGTDQQLWDSVTAYLQRLLKKA